MRSRRVAGLTCLLLSLTACSSQSSSDAVRAGKVPTAAATPAATPVVAAAPAPTAPEPSAAPTAPARTPVATALAPVAPPRPPRKVVQGNGIRITETADGQVTLKTTAKWGEKLEPTYSDCTFYLAAVPVLSEQLDAKRAKLLDRVCAH